MPLPSNPTLAYLFRRVLAARLVNDLTPGRFLEIGVGSGTFYRELAKRGFSGLCLDLNAQLIQEHLEARSKAEQGIDFQCTDFFSLNQRFDLLVAFEVLEHYEEDLSCLEKWRELLRPGGHLLISVPAHMSQWTANDTRAGHARRYEKAELRQKLIEAGFHIHRLWCYGFPVLNLTYPLSSALATTRRGKELAATSPTASGHLMTDANKTACSGARRFPWLSRLVFQPAVWWPVFQFQDMLLEGDRGTGYIVLCQTSGPSSVLQ
ncbi:MAG: class I SAM-dependent methyltransferase [Acidobacteriota bacterium]